MTRLRRHLPRLLLVGVSGACLLQAGSCVTGLTPTLLSFAESALLTLFFGQAVGP
jgi:hypothetical protein